MYLWAFWIQLSFLIISLAICGWVAASFSSGNFPYVWPIRFARTAVSTLFKTLYISSLAVFVMSFSCELGESPPVSGGPRYERLPTALIRRAGL